MFTKFKPHRPALLLIPAVLSLFWPALLSPFSVLFPTFSPFSDVMAIHWPKAHLMAQSWQAGEGLPHWTPLILSGMPLAANQLAMLSYPLAWLFLFLPIEPIFNLHFIFHLGLGGLGIYFLLRERYKLLPAAALLGGLTFALNGKWLAHAAGGHVSLVAAIGWMPWTVFGWQMLLAESEEARRRGDEGQGSAGLPSTERPAGEQGGNLGFFAPLLPSLGWTVVVAVLLAMQLVTHTLPLIYSVYLMAAMAVWHAINERMANGEWALVIRIFAYSLIRLLAILILTGLLGAAQLLPLLELAQFSNRSLSLSEATEFALSPAQLLVGLLLPTAKSGHEYVIYVGLVSLLLAPFGLTRKNRWTWFYGLLFLFTVLFALGPDNPLHSLFYYVVPGFRWVRTPARTFFVGALAIAVLVGFGADRLAQTQWSASAKKWLTRLTVAVAPLALLLGLGLAFGFGQTGPIYRAALALAIFIPTGLALILLRAQRLLSTQLTLAGLGLLLFLDLAWFDTSMLRFVPLDEALRPGRAAAEYLAQKPGYFRVYSPSYSLPMQTAAATGLSLADGVEPVHLAVYDQFMARAGGYHDASFSVTIPKFSGPLETSLKDVEPNLKLLGLLNVTYLVSAFPMNWPGLTLETQIGSTFIYRNDQALPRAWVVYQTLPTEADWLAQLEALPDPAHTALVESPVKSVKPSTFNLQPSTVKITDYSPDRIEIETETTEPGWLILSEIWYPGWQAMVNGAAQPVEKVNGLLRGLYLRQPGPYQITLEYRPSSVIWGNWISGITAVVVVAGILARWQVKRSTFNVQRSTFNIQRLEWCWVAIWTIMIMLITSLPYIYGLFLSTPQLQFSGFFLGVEDANSYLAKMRQGADGGWLFHLSFTPEPHEGAFLFTFHFCLGKLASILNWSPTWVYHLARVIFGMGLLFTVYYFISYFVQDISTRRFAFLLVALGSGLGWLVILLQLTSSLGLPLDLYVPEAFIFLVLFHLPHLALAESLLFWSILFTFQSWESDTWRPVIWAGCALLLMSLIAAFYLGVFVAVLGLTWLVLSLFEKSIQRTWKFLVKIIMATAIALPVLIYDLYVFTTNPILKIWNQQNLILSPEPWHYLLAYGLLMIPAIYGGKFLITRFSHKKAGQDNPHRVAENYKNWLLIIWCLVFPILAYLPFNLQRRLVVGVQLPLVILATYAIFQLTPKYIQPNRQQLARAGIILFFSLTNIFLLIGGVVSVSLRQPPIFHLTSQLEAMQWLDHEANGEVVLAVYETGNVLPANANVRVFVGHGPETINSDKKRAQAKTFFGDTVDDAWRLALLKKFNVRYIYYGPNEKAAGGFAPSRAPYLQEIYQNEAVQIFEVKL